MTLGERLLWLTTYAATWTADSERQRKYADASVEPGKVARAVRTASEATRALRDACDAGTVPDVELVREVLGADAVGAAAPGRSAGIVALEAAARALVGSRWPAGSVEREPLERALRDVLVRLEPVDPPGPLDPICRACGARLMFSARQRGDGLCGPCHRGAADTQAPADRARDPETQAGDAPPPAAATAGRYLVQDAHNLHRGASEIAASSAGAAARIYAERGRTQDVPDDYVVTGPDGRVFAVRLDLDFEPLEVREVGSAAPAVSTPAAPTPSRRALERVRRVNGRRRRVAAAKRTP